MGFYDDMRGVALDLLAPEAAGGLGQGAITLIRTEQTAKPGDWPTWEPWTGTKTVKTYRLYGAVSGVDAKLVDGTTILASDMMLICADRMTLIQTKVGDDAPSASSTDVPFNLDAGEIVNIDGRPMTTMQRIPVPGAGVTAAHKFIVRA